MPTKVWVNTNWEPNRTLTTESALKRDRNSAFRSLGTEFTHLLTYYPSVSLAKANFKVSGRKDGREAGRPLTYPGGFQGESVEERPVQGDGREGHPLRPKASIVKGHCSKRNKHQPKPLSETGKGKCVKN